MISFRLIRLPRALSSLTNGLPYIRTRSWQILDKSLRSCIRFRFLKKRSDMLSFKTRRSQGEKHLGLFKLLISYLTRAKIFPKIYQALLPVPEVPELKKDTGRVLSEFLMLFTNVACPPHGRSPSTDDRRKRFRHPICNWHGRTKESDIRYVLLHCLNLFAYTNQ